MSNLKIRNPKNPAEWIGLRVVHSVGTLPIILGDGADALVMAGGLYALADNSVAIGSGCIAGRMAYYIKSIDLTGKKIYLSAEKVNPPKMESTDNTDTAFETPPFDVGDYISIIAGSHYYYNATIAAIKNNVITYDGDLGFTSFSADDAVDGYTLYVPTKPAVGVVPLGASGFVAGEGNLGNGRGAFVGGRDNVGANYATVGGRGNTAGYGVGVFGTFNFVPGLASFGGGNKNEIRAKHSGFSGDQNIIERGADGSCIYGKGNTIETALTRGGGQGSKSTNGRVNTFHGENLDIEGSFNDAAGRGHRVRGDFNFVRGDYLIACGNQAVFGAYNEEDPDKLLIIGGGTASERKNIFTVDREGNMNGARLDSMQGEIDALHEKMAALSDFSIVTVMEGLTEQLAIAPRFSFFGRYFRVLADGEPIEAEYKTIGEAFQTAHGALEAENVQIELYDAEKKATCRCRLQAEYEGESVKYGHLVRE